jgi:hypothetical protein
LRPDRLDDTDAAVANDGGLSRRRPRDQDLVDAGVAGLRGLDTKQHLVAAQRARRHVDDVGQIGGVVFDERLEPASCLDVGENRRRLPLGGRAVSKKRDASSDCCACRFENPTTRDA